MNTTEKTLARDLTTRALHTAWQAGAATAGTLWASSGLSVGDLAHAHGWAVLWTVVAVGTGGAVLSAVKTSVLGWVAAHRATLEQDLVERVTASVASATVLEQTSSAATSSGPTVIADQHPVNFDPDRAAADTAPAPEPETPSA